MVLHLLIISLKVLQLFFSACSSAVLPQTPGSAVIPSDLFASHLLLHFPNDETTNEAKLVK